MNTLSVSADRRGRSGGCRDRSGFALIAVLLLLLAIAGLTTAMIVAAARDAVLTRNAARTAAARLAAESAARLALASWDAALHADAPLHVGRPLEVGANQTAADVFFAASAERLNDHAFLIRAHGWVAPRRGDPPRAEARVGATIRSLDIEALVARLSVGVESPGHVSIGATGRIGPMVEDGSVAACPRAAPSLRIDPARLSIGPGASVDGVVEVANAEQLATEFPTGIGFLDLASLTELAHRQAPTLAQPAPVSVGDECIRGAPLNWGDPAPGSACHGFLPLIVAPGGVTMSGGTGQGVLAADGDVVLTAGAVFHGIVLTSGRVIVEDGYLRGAALARGGANVTGRVVGDACSVRRALDAPPFNSAHPFTGRRLIPLF